MLRSIEKSLAIPCRVSLSVGRALEQFGLNAFNTGFSVVFVHVDANEEMPEPFSQAILVSDHEWETPAKLTGEIVGHIITGIERHQRSSNVADADN